VRTRIRVLSAGFGVALALFVFAGPAFAADEPVDAKTTQAEGEEEHNFNSHAEEECVHLLEDGGKIDDCQEAPNPLLPEVNEIIWGSAAFAVLLIGLWKFGIPAIKNMEQAREDRIRNDLESAERARAEADAEKTQYERQIADARNEAGRIIEEARQSAEGVRRDLVARAETEASEIRSRAEADVANMRTQAMAQVRDEVGQLSIELASRIVERNLDNDTNRQLVESYIDQLASSN
jgi:F-type H+-transporting ATPase subunit b